MNKLLRGTSISILCVAVASAALFACSASDSGKSNSGPTGDSGPGTGAEGGPGNEGGGGGDGGGTTFTIGKVTVGQASIGSSFRYDVGALFARNPKSTAAPMPCPSMVNVSMGACIAAVLCVPPANDAGLPTSTVLNAGAIKVAGGSGTGPAELIYGSLPGMPPRMGYKPVTGNTRFFAGGDMITTIGAGGPDLPAFPMQTVVAPSDITITSPACTVGTCPDVDRTVDLEATWTGGGAGKVHFTYETVSSSLVSLVSCSFDAAGGAGTVPAALLAHLEKGGDPGVSGIFAITAINESPVFMVSDIPTTLEVQGSGVSGALTISK